MNKEVQSIIQRMEDVNNGQPWFGRSVYSILDEVKSRKAGIKPNGTEHSMLELLWHMNTWAGFTLKRLEKDQEKIWQHLNCLTGGSWNPNCIPGKKDWQSLKEFKKRSLQY